MFKKPVSLIWLLLLFLNAKTQLPADTLRLNLDSAEKQFLTGNFSLLAMKYNIDVQKALTIQAKLYPNPNLSLFYSLYNSHSKAIFPTGSGANGGELQAQLSQLIYLAGQRNKQVKIAGANAKLAEYQFYDLIRTLKYSLRSDFYNVYYLVRSSRVYDEEISSLQQVVTAFSTLRDKGNIAEKEIIRVKAQLYTLQSEYIELINQINDVESELRLLLQVKNVFIEPVADTAAIESFHPDLYSVNTLLDSAFQNRTDLQIARTNVESGRLNYNYQKSLAVPNLTLSLAYDQQGSYVSNLTSLGAAIDLPFFNRNKGNILSAKSMNEVNTATQKSTEATVQEDVFHSLQKAILNDKMYRNIDSKFLADFDRMLHEVLSNYEKRNITLLDFLDFYDSYKTNIIAVNNIRFNRVSAFEDINFYTGTDFFNH